MSFWSILCSFKWKDFFIAIWVLLKMNIAQRTSKWSIILVIYYSIVSILLFRTSMNSIAIGSNIIIMNEFFAFFQLGCCGWVIHRYSYRHVTKKGLLRIYRWIIQVRLLFSNNKLIIDWLNEYVHFNLYFFVLFQEIDAVSTRG